MTFESMPLKQLIVTSKDGDWGTAKNIGKDGYVPYRVIRGGDFPDVARQNLEGVPICYLKGSTVLRRTLQPRDILIETAGGTKDRSTGRVLFLSSEVLSQFDLPVTCASFARFIRADSDKVSPEYLFWFLENMHRRGEMWPYNVQHTGVARFQWTQFLGEVDIPLPKRAIQNRIVDCLNCITDKIHLNQKISQTLEAMAQAIFKSWFVDFEPTKAKIKALQAGGDPADANLAAMRVISGKTIEELALFQQEKPSDYEELKKTAELFPSAMQESELGEIPEGWGVGEIGDFVTVKGGATPSTKIAEYWDDGIVCWATPKDLSGADCKILVDTERKITMKGLEKISSGLLPVDTVLLSSRAPIGYLALTKIPTAINQGFIAMVCNKFMPPEYILLWCESNLDEIKARGSGTTFSEISKKNFRPIKALKPCECMMLSFTAKVKKVYEVIENNVFEMDSLRTLRDTLLPKLISGELDVSDLADFQEEVEG